MFNNVSEKAEHKKQNYKCFMEMSIYMHRKSLRQNILKYHEEAFLIAEMMSTFTFFKKIMFVFFQIFGSGHYFMPKRKNVFLKACCKVLLIMQKMHLHISKQSST